MKLKIMIIMLSTYTIHIPDALGSNFGKTHFILGYDGQELPAIIKPPIIQTPVTDTEQPPFNLMHDNKINAVFFSPDDNVHTILEYLIGQEKKQICMAMFTFTDKKIAQALISAQQRGVRVEVITDTSSVYGKYNKLSLLHDGKITLYLYNPERAKTALQGLMHNKFFLFKDNVLGKSLVWTGSFNVTVAASKANRENVLVSEEKLYIDKFTQEFNQLKKLCDRYQKPISATSDT